MKLKSSNYYKSLTIIVKIMASFDNFQKKILRNITNNHTTDMSVTGVSVQPTP